MKYWMLLLAICTFSKVLAQLSSLLPAVLILITASLIFGWQNGKHLVLMAKKPETVK